MQTLLLRKTLGLIFMALISSVLISQSALAQTQEELGWDRAAVETWARKLYNIAWKTSAFAQGEFPGGAPGLADLYDADKASQSFLLFVKDKKMTQEKSGKWLQPVKWAMFRAKNAMPNCSPPYSDRVTESFKQMQEYLAEIERYYPRQE